MSTISPSSSFFQLSFDLNEELNPSILLPLPDELPIPELHEIKDVTINPKTAVCFKCQQVAKGVLHKNPKDLDDITMRVCRACYTKLKTEIAIANGVKCATDSCKKDVHRFYPISKGKGKDVQQLCEGCYRQLRRTKNPTLGKRKYKKLLLNS